MGAVVDIETMIDDATKAHAQPTCPVIVVATDDGVKAAFS
jgi:hypothetical protein